MIPFITVWIEFEYYKSQASQQADAFCVFHATASGSADLDSCLVIGNSGTRDLLFGFRFLRRLLLYTICIDLCELGQVVVSFVVCSPPLSFVVALCVYMYSIF